MLKVQMISKKISKNIIFEDVSIECEYGKICGFIGPNGSGKSVLFKVICGFLKPDKGEIYINEALMGRDYDFLPSLGVIIEKPGFIESYTHFKNLKFLAGVRNEIGKNEINEALNRVGLALELKQKVGEFSLGMRQRLGIAQAIMENQKILVLDEPFNSLDKEAHDLIKNLLLELKKEGKMILITSHLENDIEELADVVFEFEGHSLNRL